ncbi:LacI family DNA-binding transcriptional regulator [Branchiibius cervicis]|uniref:LacI family DNA-binding transcriptional regulator n=1 Tax=Branchiibius cervicis TaxID=908252 RepID=A0ABW2AWX3_9MICO
MTSGRVRQRDVAERAGVSVRTVSNVVNDFVHVSQDTRERVLAAVAELGYRPNLAARELRTGRSGTVSLVVPEIDSPYFSDLASRMVRAGEAIGLTVHIAQSDGDPDRERALLAGPPGREVDGVVISPWALAADDVRPRGDGPPVVMLGERPGQGSVDRVAIDNVAAARDAVAHLLSRGRRRIAAVGLQPHRANETSALRREGYRQAVAAAGGTHQLGLEVVTQTLHRSDGAAAVRRLLEEGSDFDALFCFTDELALGAMRALHDAGLRVPDDVAVVGFDGIQDGAFSVPSLTTVRPDVTRIAELALAALGRHQAGEESTPTEYVAPHRLVVRESSCACLQQK